MITHHARVTFIPFKTVEGAADGSRAEVDLGECIVYTNPGDEVIAVTV